MHNKFSSAALSACTGPLALVAAQGPAAILVALLVLCAASVAWAETLPAPHEAPATSDTAGIGKPHAATSEDARFALEWVLQHADHQRKPFAIVDKRAARIFVFEPDGRLRGSSAVLLGQGFGDTSVADIATRQPNKLAPQEQTTPSGRFASEPGHNLQGEDIVWVDYSAKVAIHRLRADAGHTRRALALASSGTADKRLSLGCIVVPVRFYEEVVRPVLGKVHGVVYVLPEQQPARRLFEALQDAANL